MRLHYKSVGQNVSEGLLFLHGFLGDHTDFEEMMAYFSKSFFCIGIDLPGHGQSEIHPQTSFETTAKQIQSIVKSQVKTCHVVGYSMGARMALYTALNDPDLFQNVYLMSGAFGFKTQEEKIARLKQDQKWIDDFLAADPTVIQRWYQQPLFDSFRAHPLFKKTVSYRSTQDLPRLGQSLAVFSQANHPFLDPLVCRNLYYFYGEWDEKYVKIASELKRYSHVKCIQIKQSGHVVHIENPSSIQKEIQKSLNLS